MANAAIMYVRATPTAQAVPLVVSTSRAEVLHTLRKQGSTLMRRYLLKGALCVTAGEEDMTIPSGVARTQPKRDHK